MTDADMTAAATKAGRILLICPMFFSYHRKISAEFAALGYDVVWWDDRVSAASPYKFMLRRFPRLTGYLSAPAFQRRITALPDAGFDHVVVVKGEGLARPVIAELRQRFSKARFSLYLWDAVENAPNAHGAADLFDDVSTFDPSDAEKYGRRYRPLFADAAPTGNPSVPDYDWSFVGTLHSDRNRVIQKLLANSGVDMRSFVFGYFPSKLLWFLHGVRDASIRRAAPGTISTTPLPAEEARRVTLASTAVLDVEHPRQKGLTIRSIETLLAGRKLITTNANIAKSRLYHETRVHIIDRQAPVVPPSFFQSDFEPIPEDVRYAYSTRCWAKEMLGESRDTNSLTFQTRDPLV